MASKESYVFLSFLVIFAGVAAATVPPIRPIDAIRRSSFPKDFIFGTASSAYQYEGAALVDGKGPSIWDTYTHQHPERIADRSNADVAVDSYNRYKEDVAIMKHLGFDSYRFSISWSRVLPKGKLSGGVNKKGIDYYNNLINELLANGIQPYVTLFHWDTPQALEDDYKSFLNYSIVHDFGDYADLCFKKFGDRVKHWMTFNEPWSFGWKAYAVGEFAPGRCSDWQNLKCLGGDSGTEPYTAIHNQILAHGVAVKIYRAKYKAHQKGSISVTLLTHWYTPYSSSEADKKAASRALDFALGWFLHPITYGDYPPSMKALVKDRLPKFTKAQSHLLKGSYDFLGMNYYTTNYAKDNPHAALHHQPSYNTDYLADLTTDKNGVSIGPKVNASSWIAVYPEGFKELLLYTKNNYQNPIIYVTENGCLDYDTTQIKNLKDGDRIRYFHGHLAALLDAMSEGVRVKGYFAWSLLDNFEWATGYTNRFGLTYIDYKNNLRRIVKDSGKWFQHFLRT